MGCTGTSLSLVAGSRWTGGQRGARLAILFGFCLIFAPRVKPQSGITIQSVYGQTIYAVPPGPDSVHGMVINGKTHEPIARALVYSPDNRYATLTDDRGHFEFKFPPQEKTPPPVPTSGTDAEGMRKVQQWYERNSRPSVFWVKRPGFLPNRNGALTRESGTPGTEMVISLEPEALIVGRVQLPGVDNTDRIQVQLYRQDFAMGHERWVGAGNFTTWANGEFRFSELAAGTYKLFTAERTERDPATFNPGDQLYGFPPVFYPNGSDFSAAAPIRLAAGATFQANMTVTRREYYPVKIGVANVPAAGYPAVEVFLQGRPGPGYSLGYDAAEQVVRGNLPDGNYTVKLMVQGETGSSGSMNFSVRGGPVEGPVVSLYPNVTLSVNITREFGPDATAEGGTGAQGRNETNGPREYVSITLQPVEQFGQGPIVTARQEPGQSDSEMTIKNVAAGSYWLQVTTNNCYAVRATWGGGDVLHRPITIGTAGGGTPIELTLRNDGAEISGSVQLPETPSSPKSKEGIAPVPPMFVYIVPVGEIGRQAHRAQIFDNGTFTATQIAPGTYCLLAFDHFNPELVELETANSELMRKYESKGVMVELLPNQTLRISSPLNLVNEP
jgi:hypothetical protein